MKRKLLLSSVVSAMLASGASAQVVGFHDSGNFQAAIPGHGYFFIYNELFAGQGAYADPGNDIWNGFGHYGAYSGWCFSAKWPQNPGNPGNPYACYNDPYNSAGLWVPSTGSSLFDVNTGSVTTCGNADSGGQWTPIQLQIAGVPEDRGLVDVVSSTGLGYTLPNGTPSYLLGNYGFNSGASPNEVFTLQNVPPGAYGLYLYGVNYANNGGTLFKVNSGSAHNGLAATVNGQNGSPAQSYVEGKNFVIFENVTPDTNGNITITASPNNLAGETDVNGLQLIFNPPPTAVGCTAAQNVWAGGTASFSFSPAFAPSPSFRWQFIQGGVTNNLSDGGNIAGSTTTNLTITSAASTNAGLYQCVITTASATNTSPAAPLTILTSTATRPLQQGDLTTTSGYILQSGDTLSDFNNSAPAVYSTIPPCYDMSVTQLVDNSLYQYENFGGIGNYAPFVGPAGFIVTPKFGAAVVTGMRLFAAGSHPEDDPADYLLEGSTDGATFTPIAGGLLALPAPRNAAGGSINITNQVLQEVTFANGAAYTTYRLTITNVSNDAIASNGVQIAEVQLLGSLPPVSPGIVQQPEAADILLVGGTLNAAVVVSGPGPFTYKWYYNTSQQIANATNATLTLTNVQATSNGNYNCVISNPYGFTNSSALNLTVVEPTSYQKSILALNPLGYWPLNETNGATAFDYVNGYNGTYAGGINLAQPGVPYQGFGSPSYCAAFDGGSAYVDIPEGLFNLTSPITILGWVQPSYTGHLRDILGHGDSSYSLAVTAAGAAQFADNGGTCTNTTPITDGNWHLVAGVYTGGSGANDFLYVDGVLVASNATSSVAGSAYDLWIGGAPDYGTATGNRLLAGNLCHVAVIPQGLSAAQIQGIYGAGGPAPTVSVPASVTVDQGGNGAISATAEGAQPITYQWSYLNQSANVVLILGATNGALQLTGIQPGWASFQYFVVVSNAYGAATSSYAVLNILSGQPVIVTDISPPLDVAPAGVPVTFSVTASGTEPFTYQWSLGSGAIAGATNASYTFNALAGSNNYSVTVHNSDGSTPSSTAAVIGVPTPPPAVAFQGNGLNWSVNGGNTFSRYVATISNDKLAIINGGDESTSAFFNTPQYIGSFFASFTFTMSGASGGTTFCLQNSSAGPGALGAFCGSLGLTGITPSAALEMTSSGVAFCTNGIIGSVASVSPVNLASGDPISVQLYYNQSVLTAYLEDAIAGTTFTTSYETNLQALLGGQFALVGFTGGTCAPQSVQTVSDFTFLSDLTVPTLSIARAAAGSAIVSWPDSISSSFELQQSTNSVNGPWSKVTGTIQDVNSQNQFTVTPGVSPAYFRLVLP